MTEDAAAEAPAWAHGYDLAELRALALPFKMAHERHVYGAFSLNKERDIAAALKAGELWLEGPTFSPSAVGLRKVLAQRSTHHDFAGRPFTLHRGAVYYRAIAGEASAMATMVREIPPRYTVVEIFEEEPLARMAMERAGFKYIMTKVTAAGEVKGIYSNARTGQPGPLDAEDVPALEILRANWLTPEALTSVRTEVAQLAASRWAQHYAAYNKRRSWTAVALRGYDPLDPSFIVYPEEMAKSWRDANPARIGRQPEWTTAVSWFPATTSMVRAFPWECRRVRFMALAPGGELSRHADTTDLSAGTREGQNVRLHIPIETNSAVIFSAWDERGLRIDKNLPAGALCYLDTRRPHAAVNRAPPTSEPRVHLVMDAIINPVVLDLLRGAAPVDPYADGWADARANHDASWNLAVSSLRERQE